MNKKKITKKELCERLKTIALDNDNDPERNHIYADDLLLEYINSPEVTEAFNSITMWYA